MFLYRGLPRPWLAVLIFAALFVPFGLVSGGWVGSVGAVVTALCAARTLDLGSMYVQLPFAKNRNPIWGALLAIAAMLIAPAVAGWWCNIIAAPVIFGIATMVMNRRFADLRDPFRDWNEQHGFRRRSAFRQW